MSYQRGTAYGLTSAAGGEWRDSALCRRFSPEIWFPASRGDLAAVQEQHALEICGRCPVRAECTSWAVDNKVLDGIWGVPEADLVGMVRERHGRVLLNVELNRRLACKAKGHPMTDDNVYIHHGKRACRQCRIEKSKAHKQRTAMVICP